MPVYKIILFCCFLKTSVLSSQVTSTQLTGSVRSTSGEWLEGATIKLLHQPTASLYQAQSNRKGSFGIQHLSPGGPYQLEVSYTGFQTTVKENIVLQLGNEPIFDLVLTPIAQVLSAVTVMSLTQKGEKQSTGVTIGQAQIEGLPTAYRNFADFIKLVPQAKAIRADDAISFAGQNNRYNIFYIDGAAGNDAFGLAASGTNGGQTGTTALSIESIEQFQISVSPYDASIGNFTGGSIHVITRSGSNQPKTSFYHSFNLPFLSGQQPAKETQEAEQSSPITLRTGISKQGAIQKNKIFYFLNMETIRDAYPEYFSIQNYKGYNSDPRLLRSFYQILQSRFGYDAGNAETHTNHNRSDKWTLRIDLNHNKKHRFTFSNRYSQGEKQFSSVSDAYNLHFSNNGYFLQNRTLATALEWKMVTGQRSANKMILTYTRIADQRRGLGMAFPRVRINDGEGAIHIGTDISSIQNELQQQNWTIYNKYNFIKGNHFMNAGMEGEYNLLSNAFLQNSYGSYTYASMGDFMGGSNPSAYRLSFLRKDHFTDPKGAAAFTVLRTSFFFNDEIRSIPKLLIQAGIRIDRYYFLTKPNTDTFANLRALPVFADYWQVAGTQSGRKPIFPISFSPRLGFRYRWPGKDWVLFGGAGFFTGRIPLVWPGGIYLNDGIRTGGYVAGTAQLQKIVFRPDPLTPWTAAETGGQTNRQTLNLMTRKLYVPKTAKISLGIEKKTSSGWAVTMECMFSQNLREIAYRNLNLHPPTDTASGPDRRAVYAATNNGRIPLLADGSNPYEYVIMLHNNPSQKGKTYLFSSGVTNPNLRGWQLDIRYAFGRSFSMHDGTASVNVSQWRFTETIHGRNHPILSESVFSQGHRLFIAAEKKIRLQKKGNTISISFTYQGQSGNPYSYVYGGLSMTRDDGIYGNYDLIYVPTKEELAGMKFLSLTVTGVTYTADQQKKALETYIAGSSYLRRRRGMYAERNGSRAPFSHRIDAKVKQEFEVTLNRKKYLLQWSLDMFNLANLINRHWGRDKTVPFDQYALLDFEGYTGGSYLIPQYRFDPNRLKETPWETRPNQIPAFASYWNCQAGIRITLF